MEPERDASAPAGGFPDREPEAEMIGKASLKPHAGGLALSAALAWYGLTFLSSAWGLLDSGISGSLGGDWAPPAPEILGEGGGIAERVGGIAGEIDGWVRKTPIGSAIAMAILVGLGARMAWGPIWRRLSYRVILTRTTIGAKAGIIARDRVDLPLSKIESVELYQTAWGRILGYGDLLVSGSGSTRLRARGIANPMAIARRAQELIQAQEEGRRGRE